MAAPDRLTPDRLTSAEQALARATKLAIQAAGGLEPCAQETGLSTSQLSRCCSPMDRDSLTIRDAEVIDSLGHGAAGHPYILHALARLGGCIVVQMPVGPDDTDGLMQSVVELTDQLGDVARSLREGLSDRIVTPREAQRSLDELNDMDAASARLRAQLMALTHPETNTTKRKVR